MNLKSIFTVLSVLVIAILISIFSLLSTTSNSLALNNCQIQNPQSSYNTGDDITFTIQDFNNPNQEYRIELEGNDQNTYGQRKILTTFTPGTEPYTTTVTLANDITSGKYNVLVAPDHATNEGAKDCQRDIEIINTGIGPLPTQPTCDFKPKGTLAKDQKITIWGSNLKPNQNYSFTVEGNIRGPAGKTDGSGNLPPKEVKPNVDKGVVSIGLKKDSSDPGITCGSIEATSASTFGQNPCSSPGPDGKPVLTDCPTAFGNIPTNPTAFAGKILEIATGLAGGIALIFMVIGSIRVLTSSGDQQKLSAGRDMIVAAIAGLLFLIFSVLILRFIGVEILNIQFLR